MVLPYPPHLIDSFGLCLLPQVPECPSNDPQLLLLIGYVFLCTRDRNLQCTVDTEISSTVSFRSLARCVDMVTIVALLHQASISGANLGFRFGAFDRAQLQNVRRAGAAWKRYLCRGSIPSQGHLPYLPPRWRADAKMLHELRQRIKRAVRSCGFGGFGCTGSQI